MGGTHLWAERNYFRDSVRTQLWKCSWYRLILALLGKPFSKNDRIGDDILTLGQPHSDRSQHDSHSRTAVEPNNRTSGHRAGRENGSDTTSDCLQIHHERICRTGNLFTFAQWFRYWLTETSQCWSCSKGRPRSSNCLCRTKTMMSPTQIWM